MELLLIRHGLPIRVEGADGPADPPLSEEGRAQAEALGRWWAAHDVAAVWSSPLTRARETAAPLAAVLGLEVAVEDAITEFDADDPHYIPIEELRADEERWEQVVAEWTAPEAEEVRQQFRRRVVEGIERIVAAHPSQRVAVVCHGGVINAYLSHLLALPGTLFLEPAYTSVSRVLAGRGGHRQLISVNERPHLPTLSLPTRF